ncbi:MAG: glycosyltransferase family 2 protein [Candidatus Levyibacteriota bacterium]
MAELSIIILNYKTPDVTLSCVESLYKFYKNEFEKNMFDVVILENGSGDNSLEKIKKGIAVKKWKHVFVLESKENLGFGNGCNFAAKQSKRAHILFLNSDTTVKSNTLPAMSEFLSSHKEIAVLGGKMVNPDGSNQLSASKFYTLGNFFLMIFGLRRFGVLVSSPAAISQVDWVSGGCMMVQREIFEKINGFDKQYFMYMEDMDLCFRARKKNYQTVFFPSFVVIHALHGSSNKSFAIMHIYKGLLHFYQMYFPGLQYNLVRFTLRAKAYTLIFAGKIMHNEYFMGTYEKALGVC